MRSKRLLALLVVVCLGSPAGAATVHANSVSDMQVVETIGAWQLRKGVDHFTDAAACVMINGGDAHFQATNHDFFIRNARSGRIYAYRLRFDDKPPSLERRAGKAEVLANTIDLAWFDFGALLSASRLRVEITTRPGHKSDASLVTYTVDLDVRDFARMRTSWQTNGCPN